MLPDLTLELAIKVAAAIFLGGLIGWQRELSHKPAGLRTHILIVLGSTVLMETSHFAGDAFGGDPTRLASNVIVGIGFIGAGTIMKEGPTVYGLTTAATIWVAGALGLAIGAGYYGIAILLTAATLLVLVVFAKIEAFMLRKHAIRRYLVVTEEDEKVLSRVQAAFDRSHFRRGGLDFRREGGRVTLTFEIDDTPSTHERFVHDLRAFKEVHEVRSS